VLLLLALCDCSLRAAYFTQLHADVRTAAAGEAHSQLWKTSVYKEVDALRTLLKQTTPNEVVDAAAPVTPARVEQLRRYSAVIGVTRDFLRACMRSYEGLCLAHLPHAGWEAINCKRATASHADAAQPSAPIDGLRLSHIRLRSRPHAAATPPTVDELDARRAHLQCAHQSLIYCGDLERYWQLTINDEVPPTSHQWSRVAHYYQLALTLMPGVGNPYNQLAVMSTYERDTLLSVHRYMRALSCVTPFATAATNLKLLLDTRREKTRASQHQQEHTLEGRLRGWHHSVSARLPPHSDARCALRRFSIVRCSRRTSMPRLRCAESLR
jgi:hypothetical protein